MAVAHSTRRGYGRQAARRSPATGRGVRAESARHALRRDASGSDAGRLRPPAITGIAVRLAVGLALFVAAGWVAGELWTSFSGAFEHQAMRELAAERTETLVSAARTITWAGSAWVLVPLAIASCVWFARAGSARGAVAIAASLGGAMLIADLVKQLTQRPRPTVEHLQAVTGSSFPSGHATQASAFWLALALALPAVGVPRRLARAACAAALVIALAVAWSRVYLGVHYPSDVVAGLLLGGGWAVFVAHATRGPASD
jgi:undecaprenyl-diphosphatase